MSKRKSGLAASFTTLIQNQKTCYATGLIGIEPLQRRRLIDIALVQSGELPPFGSNCWMQTEHHKTTFDILACRAHLEVMTLTLNQHSGARAVASLEGT